MKEVTEYTVISHYAPADLRDEVNKLIKEGWIPTGGICITQSPFTQEVGDGIAKVQTISHQAMVKLA